MYSRENGLYLTFLVSPSFAKITRDFKRCKEERRAQALRLIDYDRHKQSYIQLRRELNALKQRLPNV